MKNTILASIVAILCTVALCVTYAVSNPAKADTKAVADDSYISEEEAAEYIGVNTTVMELMREQLKVFEGAYMSYTYTNDAGEEETTLVYNKDALDEIMADLMKDDSKNTLNFKYIQQAIEQQEAATTVAE